MIDESRDKLDNRMNEMIKKVEAHTKKKEKVLIFTYLAGHGAADSQQYFILNSENLDEAIYPIEERLRILTKFSKGNCFVFAVYDICRTDATKLKQLRQA